MRPAIAIFCLILGGVLLAALVSLRTTHPDPLPSEVPPPTAEPTKAAPPKQTAPLDPAQEAKFTKLKSSAIRATLEIEKLGVIEMELYPTAAPKTVAHLSALSAKNFWDKVKVHRVDDLVVQLGDPTSKDADPAQFKDLGIGSHGSGSSVPLEVVQQLPNLTYTLGLARTEDPESGDSQFYINLHDNPDFDYKYCVFGRITKGANLVSKIKVGDEIKHFQIYDPAVK